MPNKLARAVRDYRHDHDLSQIEFARILNIQRALVADIESGDYKPHDPILEEVAEAVGFKLELTLPPNELTGVELPTGVKFTPQQDGSLNVKFPPKSGTPHKGLAHRQGG